jgi:hypothetical protein
MVENGRKWSKMAIYKFSKMIFTKLKKIEKKIVLYVIAFDTIKI